MVKKNLFVGAGLNLDLDKDDYKLCKGLLEKYIKDNKWNLKKEKNEDGFSITITCSKSSSKEILNFIEQVEFMLGEIQDKLGEEIFYYSNDYSEFQYYDLGGNNLLLGIHRFSGMMVINIMSENAINLHNEDSEMAHKIFGDYAIDGDKLLTVRLTNNELGEGFFSKIKSLFSRN